jgi:hypothetical protein
MIRMRNHKKKKKYSSDRKPFVMKFTIDVDTTRLKDIIGPQCCRLKTSRVTKNYGGFDSDDKGGALYFNHLMEALSDREMCEVLAIRDAILDYVSGLMGVRLYPFDSSMWNVFYLAYSGVDGKFGWHYDHEDETDFRILVCVEATDGAGAVEYIDEHGDVESVDLKAGEAYILKGSQTYHRVRPNKHKEDRRVMIGFHCSSEPGKRTLNLCYFANLTGWKIYPSLNILMNQKKYKNLVGTPPTMCQTVYH